jgi:hypothetical protein
MSAREQINLKSLDIYIEGPSDQQRRLLSATPQTFVDAEIKPYDNVMGNS